MYTGSDPRLNLQIKLASSFHILQFCLLNSAGITGCVPPFLLRDLKCLKVIHLVRRELFFSVILHVLSVKIRGYRLLQVLYHADCAYLGNKFLCFCKQFLFGQALSVFRFLKGTRFWEFTVSRMRSSQNVSGYLQAL